MPLATALSIDWRPCWPRSGPAAAPWWAGRALDCRAQAMLVLCWFVDGTRVAQLVRDNKIGRSTGYDYAAYRPLLIKLPETPFTT
ncbi:hypothetical protein FRAHR75_300013 [Frankia sp. Hr75.2]|nr:hypothetical protein FRAHR75_300013 [Frankia sp. Hr75.2]